MDNLYIKPQKTKTRWITSENQTGEKGKGGMEGGGTRGHTCDVVSAKKSLTIANIKGCGTIHRMWFTCDTYKNPLHLRGVLIEIYWENSKTPAVSVPFPDFFCSIFGEKKPLENALFLDPEGRSFCSHIDMPFIENAKVVIVNDNDSDFQLYYEINYSLKEKHESEIMYFHAYWHRELETKLGNDFEILPKVVGEGRYIGCNIGVIANPLCADISWFGEGECKIYIDGDTNYPTLAGTGLGDYVSTAWGLGEFVSQFNGCLKNDNGKQASFYRFHIPDPIFFDEDCKVTIQQLGGTAKENLLKIEKSGANIIPTGIYLPTETIFLLEEQNKNIDWHSDKFEDKTVLTFLKEDDYCATAYFYLNSPQHNLPNLQDVVIRQAKVPLEKF